MELDCFHSSLEWKKVKNRKIHDKLLVLEVVLSQARRGQTTFIVISLYGERKKRKNRQAPTVAQSFKST